MNEYLKVFPISEIFTSPQGEGMYCGTAMTFVRLAGCSVGKPFPKERYEQGLPIFTEMCTLYDGRTFECDTDYRRKDKLTLPQIFAKVPAGVSHLCITGGEPFIHDLNLFVTWAEDHDMQLHVETSGTIPMKKAFPPEGKKGEDVWVTVSPKFNVLDEMINRADEIKLLVDDKFDIKAIPQTVLKHNRVYLQPVNYTHEINADNLRLVMDLHKKFPNWRVSLQLHKVLSAYLNERIL